MKIPIPFHRPIMVHAMLAASLIPQFVSADPVVIEIENQPLVKDVFRFGMNIGGQTYFNSPLLKRKTAVNFEGTMLKQIHFGPDAEDNRSARTWYGGNTRREVFTPERTVYTLVSGPDIWKQGKITDFGTTSITQRNGQKKNVGQIVLDQPLTRALKQGEGIMLSADYRDVGAIPIKKPRRENDAWGSLGNLSIVKNDVPSGSFGNSALQLDAREKEAYIQFKGQGADKADLSGQWTATFWAKALAEGTQAEFLPRGISTGDFDISSRQFPLDLTGEWKKIELSFTLINAPVEGLLQFRVVATAGVLLIDDVEITHVGKNPENKTVFNDGVYEVMKDLKPGIIRSLRMGGSDIANELQATPLSTYATSSSGGFEADVWNKDNPYFTLHEFFQFCKAVGADPWYCLPGTLHKDEMEMLVEYLAAPANVGYGKKRAAMGQVEPWTSVFRNIHIEFGNEAWNNAPAFQTGGFNGPGYWTSLIDAIKQSPYYDTDKLVTHIGGQAAFAARNVGIMEDTLNADTLALAPYVLQKVSQDLWDSLPTVEDRFKWAFASPLERALTPGGAMAQNYANAQKNELNLSFYEINHHLTKGDIGASEINTILHSIGGALNMGNTMLLELKEHHAKTQCFFTFNQEHYNARGLPKGDNAVDLWGAVLSYGKGEPRYRPTFLMLQMLNKALQGDLVASTHSGNQPTFQAVRESDGKPQGMTAEYPVLWSYVFKDGDEYRMILINLDTSDAHDVKVSLAGSPRAVQGVSMQADALTAHNELDLPEPQVGLNVWADAPALFTTGAKVPPFSMHYVSWSQ